MFERNHARTHELVTVAARVPRPTIFRFFNLALGISLKIDGLRCIALLVVVFISTVTSARSSNSATNPTQLDRIIGSTRFVYTVGARPKFVTFRETTPSPSNDSLGGDTQTLLYDRQVSLVGAEPWEYIRTQTQALNSQALQKVAQIFINYNPAYQKLIVHSIRVWHAGVPTDLTGRVKLDLLRRESQLDANVYGGTVTAVGVLPGIQVGDIVDVQFSRNGGNPIFSGRYATILAISQMDRLRKFSFRLVAPTNRRIHLQAPPGTEISTKPLSNGLSVYELGMQDIEPAGKDDRAPNWYLQGQILQISEYNDWADVERWASPLFRVNEALSPKIQSQLNQWQQAKLSAKEKTMEALRWVQSQIRYFGIELGVNSHLPASPNVTVERLYGDCKDKSLLLISLLRAMGIEARPALASLAFKKADNFIPSPAVFDHSIVQAKIDGETYWLDPTLPQQYGNLDTISTYDYADVLVLQSSSSILQHAGPPPGYIPRYGRTIHAEIISYREPAKVTSTLRAEGVYAENLRAEAAKTSQIEFEKTMQADMLKIFPKAIALGKTALRDDRERNVVEAITVYSVPDFFKYETGQFSTVQIAIDLIGASAFPSSLQRTAPLQLPYPTQIEDVWEIAFPDQVPAMSLPADVETADSNWSFSDRERTENKTLITSWQLRSMRETVPPNQMRDYIANTGKLRGRMGHTISFSIGKAEPEEISKFKNMLDRINARYGSTRSPRVEAQIQAHRDIVLTTRDIGSNKLNDHQLAAAYKTRSQAYDTIGNSQNAIADIRRAIELNPGEADYVHSEAVSLALIGRFPEAIPRCLLAQAMLKKAGRQPSSEYTDLGIALHFVGKDNEAIEAFDLAIRDSSGRSLWYPAFWKVHLDQGKPLVDPGFRECSPAIDGRVAKSLW